MYGSVYGPDLCCVFDCVCCMSLRFVISVFVFNGIVLLFVSMFFCFCWRYHVLSSRVCVCCACYPNVILGVPSIYLSVCVYVRGDFSV